MPQIITQKLWRLLLIFALPQIGMQTTWIVEPAIREKLITFQKELSDNLWFLKQEFLGPRPNNQWVSGTDFFGDQPWSICSAA